MNINKQKYIDSYNKENYKMYQFRIKRDDMDIIDKLDSCPNRNQYVVNLIKDDIDSGVLTIKQIKTRIKPVLEKYNITEVYLFGSYARGEANRDSDVDIYCSSGDIKGLFQQSSFINEIKIALQKEVDVVFIGSKMHDYFKSQLEEDKIRIC